MAASNILFAYAITYIVIFNRLALAVPEIHGDRHAIDHGVWDARDEPYGNTYAPEDLLSTILQARGLETGGGSAFRESTEAQLPKSTETSMGVFARADCICSDSNSCNFDDCCHQRCSTCYSSGLPGTGLTPTACPTAPPKD